MCLCFVRKTCNPRRTHNLDSPHNHQNLHNLCSHHSPHSPHSLHSHFRRSLALLPSLQLPSANTILHYSMMTTTKMPRLSWEVMMTRKNLSIKPSWMHLEDDLVNHRARLLATSNLGRDQVSLQLASQRNRHVEGIHCRKLGSCSTGKHVSTVENHLIDLDTVLVKVPTATSYRCFQAYKLLKNENDQTLLATILRDHQQVCILRLPVLLRHTLRQRAESLRIMVRHTRTAAGV